MDADLNFTESYAKSKVIRLICVSCVLDYLYIDRHYAHELYAFSTNHLVMKILIIQIDALKYIFAVKEYFPLNEEKNPTKTISLECNSCQEVSFALLRLNLPTFGPFDIN